MGALPSAKSKSSRNPSLTNTQRTNHGDNITLEARVFFALKSGISCTNPYLITHDNAKSEPVERKTSPPKVQKVNRFTIYSHLTCFYYSYLYDSYLSRSKGRKRHLKHVAGPSQALFAYDCQRRNKSLLSRKIRSGKMETTKNPAIFFIDPYGWR